MLGELYAPKGLALETAQAVLGIKKPLAVNVGLGCTNNCSYCYVPQATRTKRGTVRLPKKTPLELVRTQIEKHVEKEPLALLSQIIEGVFISFCTDPFSRENRKATEDLIGYLKGLHHAPRVATLSKSGVSEHCGVISGMTLVSSDTMFWKTHEANALSPKSRLRALCSSSARNDETWVSMEPYPCSAIWKQDIEELLEEVKFWAEPSLIIFGKWNYDERSNTPMARLEYKSYVEVLRDWCSANRIRCYIKSDTLKFIEGAGES